MEEVSAGTQDEQFREQNCCELELALDSKPLSEEPPSKSNINKVLDEFKDSKRPRCWVGDHSRFCIERRYLLCYIFKSLNNNQYKMPEELCVCSRVQFQNTVFCI
jgi:hypothetical protein